MPQLGWWLSACPNAAAHPANQAAYPTSRPPTQLKAAHLHGRVGDGFDLGAARVALPVKRLAAPAERAAVQPGLHVGSSGPQGGPMGRQAGSRALQPPGRRLRGRAWLGAARSRAGSSAAALLDPRRAARRSSAAHGAHPVATMRKASPRSKAVMVSCLGTKKSVAKPKSSSSRKLKSRLCRSCPSASYVLHQGAAAGPGAWVGPAHGGCAARTRSPRCSESSCPARRGPRTARARGRRRCL